MTTLRIPVLFGLALLAGCGKSDSGVSKFDGSAKVGGKDAKVTKCTAKEIDGEIAAFLTLDADYTLVVGGDGIRVGKGSEEPKEAECPSVERVLETMKGGGVSATGTVNATCNAGGTEIMINGKFECGAKR